MYPGLTPWAIHCRPFGAENQDQTRLPDMRQLVFVFALVVVLGGRSVTMADPKNPTYADDVLPVLKQHCLSCHGDDKQKGGLTLATFATMQQGGSSGAVVMPGSPDKSRLFTLAAHK